MKKLNIYLFAILSSLLLFSCEEELITYQGEDFIYFKSAIQEVGEPSGEARELIIERTSAESAAEVTLSVNSYYADDPNTEATGTYVLSASSVSMAAGEYSKSITITPVDNISADGQKIVVIEIASVNADITIGYPGESKSNAAVQVAINDDDCPIDTDMMVGVFSVSEVFTSGTNEGLTLAGAFGENYLIEIARVPGDASGTKLTMSNVDGFNTYIANGTPITMNTCGKTVSFDGAGGAINIALFADLTIESATYDDAKGEIVVSGPLGGFGPYEFVLQKQ